METNLSRNDPHIAMLRGTEAELLRLALADDETIIQVLIDGARRWYERIGSPIVSSDFAAIARSMHNHFRMLSRQPKQLRPQLIAGRVHLPLSPTGM